MKPSLPRRGVKNILAAPKIPGISASAFNDQSTGTTALRLALKSQIALSGESHRRAIPAPAQ
jgi:hypothetical protein